MDASTIGSLRIGVGATRCAPAIALQLEVRLAAMPARARSPSARTKTARSRSAAASLHPPVKMALRSSMCTRRSRR